jgi:hypothetical protein
MLQYAVYSVISPEGCASILWKSADKKELAAEAMGITAERLDKLGGIVDEILREPLGGAHRDPAAAASELSTPATVNVTDRMIDACRSVWSGSFSRGGISTTEMATKRPSTRHQRMDGSRIAPRKSLTLAGPNQRRSPLASAARNSSATRLTPTKATAGQKRGHMPGMLS